MVNRKERKDKKIGKQHSYIDINPLPLKRGEKATLSVGPGTSGERVLVAEFIGDRYLIFTKVLSDVLHVHIQEDLPEKGKECKSPCEDALKLACELLAKKDKETGYDANMWYGTLIDYVKKGEMQR